MLVVEILLFYLEFLSGSFEIELISFLFSLAAITRSAHIPFLFLVAYSDSCSYTCFCFSAFFYFGYCVYLFATSCYNRKCPNVV